MSDTSAVYVLDDFEFDGVRVGIENTPRLDLELGFRALRLSVGYGPRLVAADIVGPDSTSLLLMHEGSASLRYERRRTQLALGQSLSIGEWFLGRLPQTPTRDPLAPPDPSTARTTPLVDAQSLRIRAHTTSALAAYRWTRRAQQDLNASYARSGGADADARAFLPALHTISVSSAVRFFLTPRQQLTSAAGASRVYTSNDYEHWLATVSEAFSFRATPVTSTNLTLGAVYRHTQVPDGAIRRGVVPLASGSVDHQLKLLGTLANVRAGVSLAPFVNTITGEVQTTLQGSTSAGIQRKRAGATLSIDALQSLPVDVTRATRVISGSLRGSRRVAEWAELFLGLRVQHQHIEDTALSLSLQWALSGGCAIATPPRLF